MSEASGSLVSSQRKPWNAAAIWSLVLSLCGILTLVTGYFAVATGHAALKQINADETRTMRGKTPAVIGLVLGYLAVITSLVLASVLTFQAWSRIGDTLGILGFFDFLGYYRRSYAFSFWIDLMVIIGIVGSVITYIMLTRSLRKTAVAAPSDDSN